MESDEPNIAPPKKPPPIRKPNVKISPAQYLELFRRIHSGAAIAAVCAPSGASRNRVASRYRQWCAAGCTSDLSAACFTHKRGKHRRALSDAVELAAVDGMRHLEAQVPITYDAVRDLLRQSAKSEALAVPPAHSTRSAANERECKFSDKLVQRVARRGNFRGVKLPVKSRKRPRTEEQEAKEQHFIRDFADRIERAACVYGADRVINMDETPAAVVPERVRTLMSGSCKDRSIFVNDDTRAVITANISIGPTAARHRN